MYSVQLLRFTFAFFAIVGLLGFLLLLVVLWKLYDFFGLILCLYTYVVCQFELLQAYTKIVIHPLDDIGTQLNFQAIESHLYAI